MKLPRVPLPAPSRQDIKFMDNRMFNENSPMKQGVVVGNGAPHIHGGVGNGIPHIHGGVGNGVPHIHGVGNGVPLIPVPSPHIANNNYMQQVYYK